MNVAAAVCLVVIEGASIGTPSAVMEVAVGHGEPLSIPCFAKNALNAHVVGVRRGNSFLLKKKGLFLSRLDGIEMVHLHAVGREPGA